MQFSEQMFCLIAVASFGVVVGCGSGSDPDDGSELRPDTGVTPDVEKTDTGGEPAGSVERALELIEEFRGLRQDVQCTNRWQCPSKNRSYSSVRYRSLERCKDGFRRPVFPVELRRDIADGRVEFNSEKVQTCVQSIRQNLDELTPEDCSKQNLSVVSEACSWIWDGLFAGTAEQGEACRTDRACVGELICERPTESCGGECAMPEPDENALASGEECTPGEYQCQDGLSCGPDLDDPDTTICFERGSRSEGQLCSDYLHCGDGLHCAPSLENPDQSVCIPEQSRSEGEACDSESDCTQGLSCAPSTDNEGRSVCIGEGSRAEDELCSGAVDCASDLGCGESADGRSVCQPLNLVGEGEPCRETGSVQVCQPGLICLGEGSEATCQAPKQEGDSCTSNTCAGGNSYMVCLDGTCVKKVSRGETCQSNQECRFLWCRSDDTCGPRGRRACADNP